MVVCLCSLFLLDAVHGVSLPRTLRALSESVSSLSPSHSLICLSFFRSISLSLCVVCVIMGKQIWGGGVSFTVLLFCFVVHCWVASFVGGALVSNDTDIQWLFFKQFIFKVFFIYLLRIYLPLKENFQHIYLPLAYFIMIMILISTDVGFSAY